MSNKQCRLILANNYLVPRMPHFHITLYSFHVIRLVQYSSSKKFIFVYISNVVSQLVILTCCVFNTRLLLK